MTSYHQDSGKGAGYLEYEPCVLEIIIFVFSQGGQLNRTDGILPVAQCFKRQYLSHLICTAGQEFVKRYADFGAQLSSGLLDFTLVSNRKKVPQQKQLIQNLLKLAQNA